ncbi:hypothetical protein, partial [Proteus vulgaris]|uniref:hypothetical protein n=1 Tax=Proteus vulgaris TaxID=585 RepID=UPI0019542A0B
GAKSSIALAMGSGMAHKGLLLLSFELMLFIFTAISNAAAVKVDAANSIILDLGSDKQDTLE